MTRKSVSRSSSGARLVLLSGKGGVGKTTVAAATAIHAARAGRRTLVASLDRAHNLAAVLGVAPSSSPQPVPACQNLWCIEIDPQAELATQWQLVRSTVGRLLTWLGASVVDADAMAVFPGIEELIVLARLASLAESNDYDVIVVDLAPTASSLRYLSFPDLMAGLFGKLAHLERTFARVLRPLMNTQKSVPLPADAFYAALDDIAAVLARLRDRLIDPARCVARLVAIPERIVVDETATALSALSLFGITVDTVIMNRVLPDAMSAGPWSAWRAVQERELERARTLLPGLLWRELPFQRSEPLGVDALALAGRAIYGESDPSLPARDAPPLSFLDHGDGSGELHLALPGVGPGDVDVQSSVDGVVITVGAWRRNVALPAQLARAAPVRAVVADGTLRITLATGDEPKRRRS